MCFSKKVTLILAWNNEEVARYLEAYKSLEHKPPDELMSVQVQQVETNLLLDQWTNCLTALRKVSKTDANNLLTQLKSVSNVINASTSQLENIPGIGSTKALKMSDVFNDSLPASDFCFEDEVLMDPRKHLLVRVENILSGEQSTKCLKALIPALQTIIDQLEDEATNCPKSSVKDVKFAWKEVHQLLQIILQLRRQAHSIFETLIQLKVLQKNYSLKTVGLLRYIL
ncbi:Excision repair cross-complementation group 1 [Cichlidogyrus casuarinus]|uniref:Excision repair cross-complementation group 1 n=1 Tax=Cichlidogyrus casuarinus TaxID=1844966 RepID=A0ABD2QBB8_9PLAT